MRDRAVRLAELMEQVTDEASAHRVAPVAERCFMEGAVLEVRGAMLEPPSAEVREKLAATFTQLREARARVYRQCQRLERSPRLAQLMDPVYRPSYLEGKMRVQGLGRALGSQLQTVRAMFELYALQHNDKRPDLRRQGWASLTGKTNAEGKILEDGPYGPYLQGAPVNPLTNQSRVLLMKGTPKKDFRYAGGDCGFVLDEASGRIWGLDQEGRICVEGGVADVR
jgi:hypothetical protein